MPLVESGEGYRNFSSPTVFQCDESGEIEQFDLPVDKAYMFVGDAAGSTFQIWRFDIESFANASSTVIVPINELYADFGRWIKMPISGGGGGGAAVVIGNGDPEGSETQNPGVLFWDQDTDQLYLKVTGTGDTGWILLLGL